MSPSTPAHIAGRLGPGRPRDHRALPPARDVRDPRRRLYRRIRGLGFDAIDLWGAHLNPEWATADHVAIMRELLQRRSARGHLRTWISQSNVERACELALAVGTNVIGAGMSGEAGAVASALHDGGVRLAIENHPERTPVEVLAAIDDGAFSATVDTGWWATPGYDPRPGDQRARRPRLTSTSRTSSAAASRTRPAAGATASSRSRTASARCVASDTSGRIPSSTSPSSTTRRRSAAPCASSSKGGFREGRLRRLRQHRRPVRGVDRGDRPLRADRCDGRRERARRGARREVGRNGVSDPRRSSPTTPSRSW